MILKHTTHPAVFLYQSLIVGHNGVRPFFAASHNGFRS